MQFGTMVTFLVCSFLCCENLWRRYLKCYTSWPNWKNLCLKECCTSGLLVAISLLSAVSKGIHGIFDAILYCFLSTFTVWRLRDKPISCSQTSASLFSQVAHFCVVHARDLKMVVSKSFQWHLAFCFHHVICASDVLSCGLCFETKK